MDADGAAADRRRKRAPAITAQGSRASKADAHHQYELSSEPDRGAIDVAADEADATIRASIAVGRPLASAHRAGFYNNGLGLVGGGFADGDAASRGHGRCGSRQQGCDPGCGDDRQVRRA